MSKYLDLFAGLSDEIFSKEVWSRSFKHITTLSEPVMSLFSWRDLNQILELQRLDQPKIKLYRKGLPIMASETYQSRNGRITRKTLQPKDLYNQLALGASLVVDCIEEWHRPLRDFAERLERLFHVPVNINTYAGLRQDNCFDIHWDDHNTIVLQIAGTKRWTVWAPTMEFPMKGRVAQPPDEKTPKIWNGILQEGHCFHIPRGWWHVAYPLDEPSLHLTVSVSNLTGLDFLRWFVEDLTRSKDVRMDIPILSSAEDQAQWLANIKTRLTTEWDENLLRRFIADEDGCSVPRPRLHLPSAATSRIALTNSSGIQMPGRRLHFNPKPDGAITFKCAGIEWKTTQTGQSALEALSDGDIHSIADLTITMKTGEASAFNALVMALIGQGVIITTNDVN